MIITCRLCGHDQLTPILNLENHPISHQLLNSANQEVYVHPVIMDYCEECGLLQLTDPIPPEKLYSTYNWLSSWKPNPQIPLLLSSIKNLPGIQNTSKIFEIGSNDGNFLHELKKNGFSNISGIEPSNDGTASALQKGIDTLQEYFTEKTAQDIVRGKGQQDLIVTRHVLEHVEDLDSFLKGIDFLLKKDGYLIVEIPDTDFILDEIDYSQVWEEHVNYFTLKTLEHYLQPTGISRIYSDTAQFSGQSLIYIGKKRKINRESEENFSKQTEKVMRFKKRWPLFKKGFHQYLFDLKKQDKKIAFYGAGCRSSSLINFTGISQFIEFIVDDQPEKLNKFQPGSNLPIFNRSVLTSKKIDICLLAVNAENNEKVILNNSDYLNAGGKLIPILPKSQEVPDFWTRLKEIRP